ncbi:MAG: hypothetical protein ACQCN4_02610 [Candidatus Bathyarchaeia archaeon]|jgi:hypothetical protein
MNLKTELPTPGDLVVVKRTDDASIRVGSYGIIIGEIKAKQDKTLSVVFNFTCPWSLKTGEDNKVINASGGPQREIRIALLRATRKLRRQEFLLSEGSEPSRRLVRVWNTDLTER